MSDNLREQIAISLKQCGADLCDGKLHDEERKKGRLRVLQDELRNARWIRGDDQLRAMAFAISVWIDRYYFNLSGTFPSKLSELAGEARRRLLADVVGPKLTSLGQAIERGEELVSPAYADLVTGYLDAVGEVGRAAEAESAWLG